MIYCFIFSLCLFYLDDKSVWWGSEGGREEGEWEGKPSRCTMVLWVVLTRWAKSCWLAPGSDEHTAWGMDDQDGIRYGLVQSHKVPGVRL